MKHLVPVLVLLVSPSAFAHPLERLPVPAAAERSLRSQIVCVDASGELRVELSPEDSISDTSDNDGDVIFTNFFNGTVRNKELGEKKFTVRAAYDPEWANIKALSKERGFEYYLFTGTPGQGVGPVSGRFSWAEEKGPWLESRETDVTCDFTRL